MAWKKLAFTDEMLTNPMTADLNMADYDIIDANNILAEGTNESLYLVGGNSLTTQSHIQIEGSGAAGSGQMLFNISNGAGATVMAAGFEAGTTTPRLMIQHGLDMNTKMITELTALRPPDEADVGILMEDYTGVDQVAFGIGGSSYAMVAYRPIDMNQKAFDGMVFGNLATAPHAASEVQGEAYYNTADDHIHVWVV